MHTILPADDLNVWLRNIEARAQKLKDADLSEPSACKAALEESLHLVGAAAIVKDLLKRMEASHRHG